MTNLGPEQEWYLQTLSTAQKDILQQLQIILKYFSQPVKLAISTEQISGYLAITNNLVLSGEMVLKKGKSKISVNKEIPYSIIQIENIIKYIIMASESLDVGHFITALEQIDKMSRMIRRTRQQLYFRDPSLSFAHSFIRQGSFVEKDHIIDINLNENRLIIYIYHFRKTIDYNYSLEEYQDVYKIFKRIIPNTNKHLPEIEGCIELEIEHPPMKQVLERIHVVEQLIRECIYTLQCFKK
eukprot:NODE_1143_length_2030_cov_0.555153.p2 type:complete len:240 gc:universal NODE_1143_length_2030_cov_0.555153:1254-1973(+)